ncbi:MAG: DUF202 domain-containing protein [Polyangiales bacterium]
MQSNRYGQKLLPRMGDVVDNLDSTARDHLANERTFLAWVRTALGMVGLGVVVERLVAGEQRLGVLTGVAFIGFGGLALMYALGRYLWVAKNLERGLFPVALRGPVIVAMGALFVTVAAMLYVLI